MFTVTAHALQKLIKIEKEMAEQRIRRMKEKMEIEKQLNKEKSMKAEFVTPKVDRDVKVILKESQAIEIRNFIGGTASSQRKEICNHQYKDVAVSTLYNTLELLLGNIHD